MGASDSSGCELLPSEKVVIFRKPLKLAELVFERNCWCVCAEAGKNRGKLTMHNPIYQIAFQGKPEDNEDDKLAA